MKEFIVYTGLRLLLFLATWGVLIGAWVLVSGKANLTLTLVAAFVISGLGSYFLLQAPRAKFAARVEARADKAMERFEENRAREDVD